ncbi:hypothetical protein C0J52_17669 [Blattella germanica]|nr:hypothetical protein C0J52_17669 [Blattella germanica]
MTIKFIVVFLCLTLVDFTAGRVHDNDSQPAMTVVHSRTNYAKSSKDEEFEKLSYRGRLSVSTVARNMTLGDIYPPEWTLYYGSCATLWYSEESGPVYFSEAGFNFWEVNWVLPANASVGYEIDVILSREVTDNYTGNF